MAVLLDSLLEATPGTCGGRLRIAGTRFTVLQAAHLYRQGYSAEDIHNQYPHLEPAGLHAALAYFHANRDAVIKELAEEEEEARRLAREQETAQATAAAS